MQFEAQEVFDLSREPAAVRQLYGDGQFANACLMARRLAERGVRMTQIYYGNGQPWDDHADILNHRNHAKASTRPIAALLTDLKQTRPAGRDAGGLGRRVRPDADVGGPEGPRPQQQGLHRCGWPAAASRAA